MEHVLPTQGSSSHRLRGVGTCEVPGACYAFAHYGDYLFAGSDERVSVIGWGLRNVEVLAECFTACRSAVTALCAIDGKGVLKRRKRGTAGEDDEAGDEIGDDKEVCIFVAAAELLHSAWILVEIGRPIEFLHNGRSTDGLRLPDYGRKWNTKNRQRV